MAADNPYQLDPFTTIKSINFGSGVWCVLVGAASPQIVGGFINGEGPPSYADVAGSTEADFSAVAGGTPGFTLTSDIAPITGFKTSPYTVQKADLTHKILTGGGAGLIGFPVGLVTIAQAVNPPFTKFHSPQGGIILLCSGLLAKAFTVRMTGIASNTNTQGALQVGLFAKNSIKAGVRIDLANGSPPVASSAEKSYGKANSTDNVVADFIVNPVTMTVTGPL